MGAGKGSEREEWEGKEAFHREEFLWALFDQEKNEGLGTSYISFF